MTACEMQNELHWDCNDALIVQRSASLGMQKLEQNLAGGPIETDLLLHDHVLRFDSAAAAGLLLLGPLR